MADGVSRNKAIEIESAPRSILKKYRHIVEINLTALKRFCVLLFCYF